MIKSRQSSRSGKAYKSGLKIVIRINEAV